MITYYVGASIDGFIATEDDKLDFLGSVEPPAGEDYGYDAFYRTVDVCVWGRKTYDWVMKRADFPYPGRKNWILSQTRSGAGKHGEEFAIFDAGHWRRLSADKHIWMVGGGEVASLFLSEGLIEQLIPTKIDKGKELFTGGFNAAQWKLESGKDWSNGVTQHTYSFVRKREGLE